MKMTTMAQHTMAEINDKDIRLNQIHICVCVYIQSTYRKFKTPTFMGAQ